MKRLILNLFLAILLFSFVKVNAQDTYYPYNSKLGQKIQTNVRGTNLDRGFVAHFEVSAANADAASTTAVHAAVTDTGGAQTITTGITNPEVPRNITATAGGTAGDIKAISVIVNGTDFAGVAIADTLPAFTVNTAGTVQGTKAFKTVTSIVIPAHDGTGATTAIGRGDKLGLPFKLAHNTVLLTFMNNTIEGTAPTVTTSSTSISNNTIDLNSALNGTKVDVYLIF